MSTALATTFSGRLEMAVRTNDSLLCVGLDPDIARIPRHITSGLSMYDALLTFLGHIVEATSDFACCFKPNIGFFLAHGPDGWSALLQLRSMIPDYIPMLLDAKFGDIGPTAEMCARSAFDVVNADAVTVSPYVGGDALKPFFVRADRTTFVLCKTSNPGSGEIQDLNVEGRGTVSFVVAERIRQWGAEHNNVGAVVGATYPDQMVAIRANLPDAPILVPGVGVQGGDLERSLRSGMDNHQSGLLLNASRSILYASSDCNYADAAREEARRLRNAINTVRWQAG